MPMRFSISVSLSMKVSPSWRARCRPTVDLPQPGMPTRDKVSGKSQGTGQAVGRVPTVTLTAMVVPKPLGDVKVTKTMPLLAGGVKA